ncbi:SigE family RNA polymerase sigma factor [Phytomonospora sp. NPDC050363]|uniref:SigE family RNA polymerase sigma factor n=1 Tax=Phytomonospora sp. NPDC050363 TaxID=3155642 RepID=UPI00340CE7C2
MRAEREADFREFVAGRTEALRVFAYLCCGDWHRAEDAVQTALIRLYGAWSRAKKISVEAYVRRIIVNVLIDEHRLAWFRRVKIGGESAVPKGTVVDARRADERLMLTEALQRLPKRQRAAIVLRFWEDLPVEQTAQIMGCSTGAVKNLTMRGLATLRGLMTDSALEDIQGASS